MGPHLLHGLLLLGHCGGLPLPGLQWLPQRLHLLLLLLLLLQGRGGERCTQGLGRRSAPGACVRGRGGANL